MGVGRSSKRRDRGTRSRRRVETPLRSLTEPEDALLPRVDDPGSETNRWVADRSAAGRAATALLVQELRRGRVVLAFAATTLGLTLLLMTAGRTSSDHNVVLAFLSSFALTAFLFGSAIGIAHLQRRRGLRAQLVPGLELTSRFGPDFVVLGAPSSETTMQFDGFVRLEVVRGWVLLRQRHRKVQVMFPVELFPRDDLGRLRLVLAGLQVAPLGPSEEPPPPASG